MIKTLHCFSKDFPVLYFSLNSPTTLWLCLHFQIDVLINNGGRTQRSIFIDTDVDVYEALMELNYLGTVSVTKQVLPHMMRRGSGIIATVSSVAGFVGVPLATGYSASKHAVQVRANITN